jgi:hypothetical protein
MVIIVPRSRNSSISLIFALATERRAASGQVGMAAAKDSSVKTIRSAYLYADGHAVLICEDEFKGRKIDHVEIIENYGPRCNFHGRVIFSNPDWYCEFDLAKKAEMVDASEASIENGSDHTRSMGIAVGSLKLHFAKGKQLHITSMPRIISAPFTYQPETVELFDADCTYWSGMPVTKITRATSKAQELQAAA